MGKKNTESELAKVEEAPLAMPAPSYIDKGRDGYENVVDMTFERIQLLQAMSPIVSQDTSLAAGMLYRRSTGEVLYTPGAPALGFGIAFYFKEWVEFGDREDQKQSVVLGRSTDPSSKLAEEARQWVKKKVTKGEVRKVTDVHNFVILRDGQLHDPVLVACMRSNARYGTGLLNLSNGRGNVPIYAGRFLLYSEKETNKRNQTFNVIKFKNPPREEAEFWVSREAYEAAKSLHEMLASAHKAGKLGGNYQPDDQGEAATPDAEL